MADEVEKSKFPTSVPKIISLDEPRAVLNSLREKWGKKGVVQAADTLRLEAVLSGSTKIVEFEVIREAAQGSTEKRLDRSDSFTALEVGYFLGIAPTGDPRGNMELHTWINPLVFPTIAAAHGTFAMHNAVLKMIFDVTQFMDSWDLQRCRNVGVAQAGVTIFTASTYLADQWDGLRTGFARLLPTLTLSGAMKNKPSVVFDDPITFTEAGFDLYLVLELRGFRNAAGAEFRTSSTA